MRGFSLLKSQKNKLFKLAREAGLDPARFEFREVRSEFYWRKSAVPFVGFAGTNFYFEFDKNLVGKYVCTFYPNESGKTQRSAELPEWVHTLLEFQRWLSCLKQEVLPDLWEQWRQHSPKEKGISPDESSNEAFSSSEAQRINEVLDRFEAEIEKNLKLHANQVAFVKKEMRDLREAAKHQGRRAWMHTLIGVIVTIATGLALSPEKTALLWELARSYFAGLVRLPAP